MPRLHLFEILDQSWCPRPVRDGATDFLEAITGASDVYRSVRADFLAAMLACRANQIVDLCSGGGGPWLSKPWQAVLEQQPGLRVLLTDKFPSRELCAKLGRGAAVSAVSIPVDAGDVPAALNGPNRPNGTDAGRDLRGFRTLFSSFHHFSDDAAIRILADAVRNRHGMASAEVTLRRPRALFVMCLMPLFVWALTPRIRPFRWSRLLLTYLLPVIPFVVCFDGIVSCLRARTPEELLALTHRFPEYIWKAGYGEGRWLPPVYLIGVPRANTRVEPEFDRAE
ncbi:MAG TPA: hypothetical protein VHX11_01335 [Acidobacteriaceae bacterium]|nr:hypothetical protein [Acidobacteriaceae bacterium]